MGAIHAQTPQVKITNRNGCVPLLVKVQDTTAYVGKTAVNHIWYWGDNTSFTHISDTGSHAYYNSGLYTLKMVVFFSNGSTDSVTYTNIINVYKKPLIDFSIQPKVVCNPGKVWFVNKTNYACGGRKSMIVDYGDGIIDDSAKTFAFKDSFFHSYANAGVFNVKFIIRNECGCLADTIYLNAVTVKQSPKASFTIQDTFSCAPSFTTNFGNTSTQLINAQFEWYIGNNLVSTATSPNLSFNSPPYTYNVRLIAINPDGNCRDTSTKIPAVRISNKVVSYAVSKTDACAGRIDTLQFSNTTAGATACYWDFGDGTFSNDCFPKKVYAFPGAYSATLIATFIDNGRLCTKSFSRTITVHDKPKIQFYASDTIFCVPKMVNFRNLTTGASSYQWWFSGGTPPTSTAASPNIFFNKNSHAQLIAISVYGCPDTFIKWNYINYTGVKKGVTYTPESGCAPVLRTFTDFTQLLIPGDSILSIAWDFNGDNVNDKFGKTVTQNFPFLPCKNNIRHRVTTKFGCIVDSIFTLRQGVPISPDFQFLGFAGCKKDSMLVKYTGALPPAACVDIFSANLNPPDKELDLVNPVYVKLSSIGNINQLFTITATLNGCQTSTSKNITTNVTGPIAIFSILNNCAYAQRRTLNFANNSIDADSFWWYKNNVLFSRNKVPPTQNVNFGTTYFSLKTFNKTTGCFDSTTTKYRTYDTVDIFVYRDKICETENLYAYHMHDSIDTRSWYLNGGIYKNFNFYGLNGDDNIEFPMMQKGFYTVTLITTDYNNCIDTFKKPFIVNRLYGTMLADSPVCRNQFVKYTFRLDSSYLPISTHIFNDGISVYNTGSVNFKMIKFATPGNKNVVGLMRDVAGCQIVKTASVKVVDVNAFFTKSIDSICPGQSIVFAPGAADPNTTYAWSFEDASPNTSNQANPSAITFNSLGNKNVSLAIYNGLTGCRDTFRDIVHVIQLKAGYYTDKSSAFCNATTVSFFDSSKGNISKYFWDFGDGAGMKQLAKNPQCTYLYPDNYWITLMVENPAGCRDSIRLNAFNLNGPSAKYTLRQLDSCEDAPMSLEVRSKFATKVEVVTGLGISTFTYPANFCGVTNIHCLETVNYVLTAVGPYTPQIYVTDGLCNYYLPTKTVQINIYDRPDARFDMDSTFCKNTLVLLRDSSIFNKFYSKTWLWNLGNGGGTATAQNPIYQFPQSGKQAATQYVSSAPGCMDSFVKMVDVFPLPAVQYAMNDTCINMPVIFANQSPKSFMRGFLWNFGDGVMDSINATPMHTYANAGKYPTYLVMIDSNHCRDTLFKEIFINRPPDVNLLRDTIKCADEVLYFAPFQSDKLEILNLFDSEIFQDTIIKSFNTKDYTFKIKATNRGCASVLKDLKIRVVPLNQIDITANPTTIDVGEKSQLNLTASLPYTSIAWLPVESLSCIDCKNPLASPLMKTSYTAQVTYALEGKSCKVSDTIEINIDDRAIQAIIKIPGIFSPNGDNVNDKYRLSFIDPGTDVQEYVCRIYNRWGENVFESFNPGDSWDGTFKGSVQPVGAYILFIKFTIKGKKPIVYMAPISLVR